MSRLSERSKKIDIWKAYEQLKSEADRHQKVLQGLSGEFSSLQGKHKRLQEKTDFIDGLRRRLGSLNERMDLLTKISQELNSLRLDRILDLCVSKVPFLINAKYTSVYLYSAEKDLLTLGRNNHDREIRQEIPPEETHTLMGMARERREILLIRDVSEFSREADGEVLRPYAEKYATRSCIVAPLVVGDQLVGVINFADRNDGKPFDEETDLPPIRTLVGILAAAIRNVQLYGQVQRQATLDGLTGLLNHSAFIRTLDREVARARRYELALTLILTDVDRFHSHNANLGHEGGDRILAMVSQVLTRTPRIVDLAGRYGPDEFAVILPETPLEGARAVAARILDGVREEKFTYNDRSYAITATAGVVALTPDRSHTEMLSLAEAAIQEIRKEGGLGQVTVVESPK